MWLRYDRGFRRKAACSPVPLDWSATNLEVFTRPMLAAAFCKARLRPHHHSPFIARPSLMLHRSPRQPSRHRGMPDLEQWPLHQRLLQLQMSARMYRVRRVAPSTLLLPTVLRSPQLTLTPRQPGGHMGPLTCRHASLLVFTPYLPLPFVTVLHPFQLHRRQPLLLQFSALHWTLPHFRPHRPCHPSHLGFPVTVQRRSVVPFVHAPAVSSGHLSCYPPGSCR